MRHFFRSVSGQSLVRGIFCVFHPFSHPLSATFVWPIKIQVHCENQSFSMSGLGFRDELGLWLSSGWVRVRILE